MISPLASWSATNVITPSSPSRLATTAAYPSLTIRPGTTSAHLSAAFGPYTLEVRYPVAGQRILAGEPLPPLAAQRTVSIGHLQLGQVLCDTSAGTP